jgi:hypothetical protein
MSSTCSDGVLRLVSGVHVRSEKWGGSRQLRSLGAQLGLDMNRSGSDVVHSLAVTA